MTPEIDLRNVPAAERRSQLVDALEDVESGDDLAVVTSEDVDPQLVRYQLDHGRKLDWEYDHPDEEPRRLRVIAGDALGDDRPTIDVRDLKPQRRHGVLLDLFEDLDAEEGFVLVNDHDPKPLYHELRSLHGDVVDWSYASEDDGEWRVEVGKTADSEAAADDDVLTRYDVREIPKRERHPTIHHRYGMLPTEATMEIVAPHEPRPLHREFRRQYGDAFEWEVVEQEPGRCRVWITKTAEAADTGGAGADHACAGAAHHGVATVEDGTDDAAVDGSADGPADGRGDAATASIDVVDELDVRELPPAQRHELIFETYAELDGGDGFVLVNDHDPKPLYHQFDAEAGPAFRWEYRQREPGAFRVLIGKSASGEPAAAVSEETEAPF